MRIVNECRSHHMKSIAHLADSTLPFGDSFQFVNMRSTYMGCCIDQYPIQFMIGNSSSALFEDIFFAGPIYQLLANARYYIDM